MGKQQFTKNDYFSASLERREDMRSLKNIEKSNIYAVYTAGVSVESMFRAYISMYTKEFDSKHDIVKLFIKSLLSQKLTHQEKEKTQANVMILNKYWNNSLRYTSKKRYKRMLGRGLVQNHVKNINQYLSDEFEKVYDAAEHIVKIGESKWT